LLSDKKRFKQIPSCFRSPNWKRMTFFEAAIALKKRKEMRITEEEEEMEL
jgi:hypothetical protein